MPSLSASSSCSPLHLPILVEDVHTLPCLLSGEDHPEEDVMHPAPVASDDFLLELPLSSQRIVQGREHRFRGLAVAEHVDLLITRPVVGALLL